MEGIELHASRTSAIDCRTGADAGASDDGRVFHEDGLIAVYKLVSIIEVRNRKPSITTHRIPKRKPTP